MTTQVRIFSRFLMLSLLVGASLVLSSQAYSRETIERWRQVSEGLNRCNSGEDLQGRNLKFRLHDAVTSLAEAEQGCSYSQEAPGFRVVEATQSAFEQIRKRALLTELQEKLYRQSIKNSVRQYVLTQYSFWPDSSDPKQRKVDPSEILRLCRDEKGKSVCSKEHEAEMIDLARQALKDIERANVPQRTYSEVLKDLNGRIDYLNREHLAKMEVDPKDMGGWFSSANINPELRQAFEIYLFEYDKTTSDLEGTLLLTTVTQKKIKVPYDIQKDLESAARDNGKSQRRFFYRKINSLHKPAEIDLAVKSALYEIAVDAREMHEMQNQNYSEFDSQRVSDLEDVIASRPLVVAQVLLESPEYADVVCLLIGGVNQMDGARNRIFVSAEMIENASLVAALGSGGTSLFLKSGLWILRKSATQALVQHAKKVAFTEKAAKVFAATSPRAMVIVPATDTAEGAGRLGLIHGKEDQYRRAQISGMSDPAQGAQVRDYANEGDEAATKVVVSGLETAGGVYVERLLTDARKYGSLENARRAKLQPQYDFLKGLRPVVKEIDSNKSLKRIIELSRAKKGDRITDRFIVSLSEAKAAERKELLNKLQHLDDEYALATIESLSTRASGQGIKYLKGVNITRMAEDMRALYGPEFGPLLETLSAELGVPKVEILRRMSQAKVSAQQLLKEIKADKGPIRRLMAQLAESAKDPKKLTELLKDPKTLIYALTWGLRDSTLGTPNLKRAILINVLINGLIGLGAEMQYRGRDFWADFPIFMTNLTTSSMVEVVLTLTGSGKLVSKGKKAMGFARTMPDNMFEGNIFKSGPFTIVQRAKRWAKDGATNGVVAVGAGLSGPVLSEKLLESTGIRSVEEQQYMDHSQDPDRGAYVLTTFITSVFSGNTRYQALARWNAALNGKVGKEIVPSQAARDLLYAGSSAANTTFGRGSFVYLQSRTEAATKELQDGSMDEESFLDAFMTSTEGTAIGVGRAVKDAAGTAAEAAKGLLVPKPHL